MRYILSVILSIFCFVIPVYAVPDDFLLENSDNFDTTAYYDLSDTNDIYRGSFNTIVRSPSINPDVPFTFYGFTLVPYNDESMLISINYSGTLPEPYNRFRINGNFNFLDGTSGQYLNCGPVNFITNSNYPIVSGTINNIQLNYTGGSGDTVYNGSYSFDITNVNETIGTDVNTATFLTDVTTIFTWLLTSIASLIVFILGNPFLAVMLALFLAGTVISFFIRIRG